MLLGANYFIELMTWKEGEKNQRRAKLPVLNNLPFASWTNGSNEHGSEYLLRLHFRLSPSYVRNLITLIMKLKTILPVSYNHYPTTHFIYQESKTVGRQFAQAHTIKEMSRMTFKPTLACTHASISHHPLLSMGVPQLR